MNVYHEIITPVNFNDYYNDLIVCRLCRDMFDTMTTKIRQFAYRHDNLYDAVRALIYHNIFADGRYESAVLFGDDGQVSMARSGFVVVDGVDTFVQDTYVSMMLGYHDDISDSDYNYLILRDIAFCDDSKV